MTVLVVAEHESTSLKNSTLNTTKAAAEICFLGSGEVNVLVIEYQAQSVTKAAADTQGVSKVISSDGLAENVAAQVQVIAPAYNHILFQATAGAKSVSPRVAAKLDVAQSSDITKVITERTAGFDVAGQAGSAAVETVAAASGNSKSAYPGSSE